ncbi:MAG: amidohydrolase family protein [Planctomycetes bacterium]|nr:amidohydrolase family protein [Planctomycetota bacterium]
MTRRRRCVLGCAIAIVLLPVLLWSCAPLILGQIAGASRHAPEEMERGLSPAARALFDRAYAGLDSQRLLDVHTHVAGLGANGSGCSVNPEMLTWAHPWKRAQFLVYAHAARITDLERGDEQFAERLRALVASNPRHGRHGLLAFDRHYRADGTIDEARTEMHVPNDWVFTLAARDPELFVPVCSVHPYRKDALQELERCAAKGAKLCKWLPNAMGIDPMDPKCDAFYAKAAELGVALLSHSGDEHAVDAEGAQDLGNPLRLRRALEHGATVVLAHCATLGEGVDLDDPSSQRVPNFELFLRLMGEERWKGRLFGEISAVVLANRATSVVGTLLERTDLHARLVNGSDYPLPAIRVVWSARRFANDGYLTDEEARALEELYDYNPLVFDFVLKRTLKHPKTGARFADDVFLVKRELGY